MAEIERREELRRRWEADLAEDRVPADWAEPLPEASYPLDEHRGHDLANFDKPIEHYVRYYEDYLLYLEVMDAHWTRLWQQLPDEEHPAAFRRWTDGNTMYDRHVLAQWGMLARGAEAVTYCLALLKHPDAEVRSDGAAVLGAVGRQDGVIDSLMLATEETLAKTEFEKEDYELIDTLLFSLGQLKNRRAVPLIARVIRDETMNYDTHWNAAESLGFLVRRRFAAPDPVAPALLWLQLHGH